MEIYWQVQRQNQSVRPQELLVLNHITQHKHRGTSYRLLKLIQADLECHFLFPLHPSTNYTHVNATKHQQGYLELHAVISRWQAGFMAQKHGIKNKNQDYFLPTWYGNLTLVLQGALLFQMCCFPLIIPEQKGSIATAWKCRKLLGSTSAASPVCVM